MLRRRVARRVGWQDAGMVEVDTAVRRHRAVLRLKRQVAAAMDAHAPVIERIPAVHPHTIYLFRARLVSGH